MKRLFIAAMLLTAACNQGPKNPIAVADSTNNAKQSQAAMNDARTATADSASAAFLVRASAAGLKTTAIAKIENDKGSIPSVKNFAAALKARTDALNKTIRQLATQKNVTLPDSIPSEAQNEIDRLFSKLGSQVDQQFIKELISSHKKSINYYEAAAKNAGDAEVRAFADQHLAGLRTNLDSAKSISEKYW